MSRTPASDQENDDRQVIAGCIKAKRSVNHTGSAASVKAPWLGQATLWMAVFADVGASLIVIANSLRLLRIHDRLREPCHSLVILRHCWLTTFSMRCNAG